MDHHDNPEAVFFWIGGIGGTSRRQTMEMTMWPWRDSHVPYGYGSVPINTIFRGMNIHLPAIFIFTRGTRFWPFLTHPQMILGIIDAEIFQWIPPFPMWPPRIHPGSAPELPGERCMASPTRRVAGGDPGAGAADRRRERAPGRWRLVAVGGGWWRLVEPKR